MPDNTLRQRLEDSIGEITIEPTETPLINRETGARWGTQEGARLVPESIEQAKEEIALGVEADLKGLLPEEKPASASVYNAHNTDNRTHFCDYTLQIQLSNEVNKGYNQAIADITAAIERYCRNGEGK